MAKYKDAKTYVVAWMSFFDNILHQEQVLALHEYHALEESSQGIFELNDFHTITSMEDLHDEAFNRDCVFSVIEVIDE